jgi:hypothetical protein
MIGLPVFHSGATGPNSTYNSSIELAGWHLLLEHCRYQQSKECCAVWGRQGHLDGETHSEAYQILQFSAVRA